MPNHTALPVLVYIHGGGFVAGDSQLYPGDALITHSKSLIYVSIQYRLGPYGFLSGRALKADGVPNVGLLDQKAAIEWVHRHISDFGGDPDQITIAGASAGGASVALQMHMYSGPDLPPFQGAIAGKICSVHKPLNAKSQRLSMVPAIP